jgi:hypothetical protein
VAYNYYADKADARANPKQQRGAVTVAAPSE